MDSSKEQLGSFTGGYFEKLREQMVSTQRKQSQRTPLSLKCAIGHESQYAQTSDPISPIVLDSEQSKKLTRAKYRFLVLGKDGCFLLAYVIAVRSPISIEDLKTVMGASLTDHWRARLNKLEFFGWINIRKRKNSRNPWHGSVLSKTEALVKVFEVVSCPLDVS